MATKQPVKSASKIAGKTAANSGYAKETMDMAKSKPKYSLMKKTTVNMSSKSAAPKGGGGTTPKDNAKTKTFAKNAGVNTMKSLGSNNATVTTKGGRTELATYYQGKDKSGSTVTVPNKTFAGKTTAQVDSIANTMGVPKGGFKKVTTSTYRSNESMKTPKGTITLKKPAKVTAKK